MGRKQTLNLPASTPLNGVAKEITKLCGYVQGTVSVRYEQQLGDTISDVSAGGKQEREFRLSYYMLLNPICLNNFCCVYL